MGLSIFEVYQGTRQEVSNSYVHLQFQWAVFKSKCGWDCWLLAITSN